MYLQASQTYSEIRELNLLTGSLASLSLLYDIRSDQIKIILYNITHTLCVIVSLFFVFIVQYVFLDLFHFIVV